MVVLPPKNADKPRIIVLSDLTDDEFNDLMEQAAKSYREGRVLSHSDFEKEFYSEINVPQ